LTNHFGNPERQVRQESESGCSVPSQRRPVSPFHTFLQPFAFCQAPTRAAGRAAAAPPARCSPLVAPRRDCALSLDRAAPSRLPESLDSRLSVSKAPIYKTNHPRVTHDTRDATVSHWECRILCPAIIGHSLAAHAHAPTRPTPLDGADRVRAGELLERRHLRRRHGRLCAAPAEDLAAHRKRPRRLVEAEQER
jgi:hypothetical protein